MTDFSIERLPTDGPFVHSTGRTRIDPLWHSEQNRALILPVNIALGYGVIPAGTIMAKNASAGGRGDKVLVPYPCTDFLDGSGNVIKGKDLGRAFLVTDLVATGTTIRVADKDGSKFYVGDDLVVEGATTTAEDLGAITSKTQGNGYWDIEVTVAASDDFLLSDNASCYLKTSATGRFAEAFCILGRERNTGFMEKSNATMPAGGVFKYATLLKDYIPNLDDDSVTDLDAKIYECFITF